MEEKAVEERTPGSEFLLLLLLILTTFPFLRVFATKGEAGSNRKREKNRRCNCDLWGKEAGGNVLRD